MAYENQKHTSLVQVGLPANNFQGTSFNPQAANMDLYQRMLLTQQARKDQANKDYSDFGKDLGKIEEQLHNDPVTKAWFQDYKERKLAPIQEEIDAGNYGNALNAAVKSASDITRDPEVLGRIKANENFQQERKVQQQRREAGKISQATYDWWDNTTPFEYKDMYDADGNIVGGSDGFAKFRPVDDLDMPKVAATAFSLIKSKKGSKDNSFSLTTDNIANYLKGNTTIPDILKQYFEETTDANGNRVIKYANKYGTASESIDKQDILDNIDFLIKMTGDGERSVKQLYDVAKFEADRLKQKYDEEFAKDPTSDATKEAYDAWTIQTRAIRQDGTPVGFKNYYANLIYNNLFANKLAFNHTTTKDEIDIYDVTNTSSSGGSGGNETEPVPESTSFEKGATVAPNPNKTITIDEMVRNTQNAMHNAMLPKTPANTANVKAKQQG